MLPTNLEDNLVNIAPSLGGWFDLFHERFTGSLREDSTLIEELEEKIPNQSCERGILPRLLTGGLFSSLPVGMAFGASYTLK